MELDLEKAKKKIKDELEKLRHELQKELPRQISESREQGDLRENAGYHAARERMGFVKARVSQLSEQLSKLNNIDLSTIPADSVGFGSRVVLLDLESGNRMELTFVTEGEVNITKGRITLETPYGKALQGKKAGATIEVLTPAGIKKFYLEYLRTLHGQEFRKER